MGLKKKLSKCVYFGNDSVNKEASQAKKALIRLKIESQKQAKIEQKKAEQIQKLADKALKSVVEKNVSSVKIAKAKALAKAKQQQQKQIIAEKTALKAYRAQLAKSNNKMGGKKIFIINNSNMNKTSKHKVSTASQINPAMSKLIKNIHNQLHFGTKQRFGDGIHQNCHNPCKPFGNCPICIPNHAHMAKHVQDNAKKAIAAKKVADKKAAAEKKALQEKREAEKIARKAKEAAIKAEKEIIIATKKANEAIKKATKTANKATKADTSAKVVLSKTKTEKQKISKAGRKALSKNKEVKKVIDTALSNLILNVHNKLHEKIRIKSPKSAKSAKGQQKKSAASKK